MAGIAESKIEHLRMIQDVISRMAQNSFQLKGWAITLVTAALALAGAQGMRSIALAGLVPTIGFWFLDAYYLRQERLFRKLYDHVRDETGEADFSMNTSLVSSHVSTVLTVAWSRTIWPFYGVLLAATAIASVLIRSGVPGC